MCPGVVAGRHGKLKLFYMNIFFSSRRTSKLLYKLQKVKNKNSKKKLKLAYMPPRDNISTMHSLQKILRSNLH